MKTYKITEAKDMEIKERIEKILDDFVGVEESSTWTELHAALLSLVSLVKLRGGGEEMNKIAKDLEKKT